MEENSLAFEMLGEIKKTNKRLFITIIILIVALIISNAGWLIYESNFEYGIDEQVQTIETSDIDNSNITQY